MNIQLFNEPKLHKELNLNTLKQEGRSKRIFYSSDAKTLAATPPLSFIIIYLPASLHFLTVGVIIP